MLARKVRRKFGQLVYRKIEDVIFRTELDGKKPSIRNQTIMAVEGSPESIKALRERYPDFVENSALIDSFFANNYRVMLAILGDVPIGYVWWTDDQVRVQGTQHPHIHRYDIKLGHREAWGFSLDLLPHHRGDGKADDFFHLFQMKLHELGYTVLWGSAQKDNLPAIWLHRMQGFEEVKTVTSTQLFKRWLHVDGGRWYVLNGHRDRQQFDYRLVGRATADMAS